MANCYIYRLMYPSEITSQFIPLNNDSLAGRSEQSQEIPKCFEANFIRPIIDQLFEFQEMK